MHYFTTTTVKYIIILVIFCIFVVTGLTFMSNQTGIFLSEQPQDSAPEPELPQEDPSGTVSESFVQDTAEFGALLQSGDTDAALLAAQNLLRNSESDIERGRATLSLALVEKETDIVQATERFKQISSNEAFHPVTRSFAMWYALEAYFGTRDVDFAAEHIYTGPMWESFVEETYADDPELQYRVAATNALRASLDQVVLLQSTMRLANETVVLTTYDRFSEAEKVEIATETQEYISLGDSLLDDVEGNYYYEGTGPYVLVTALNSKALALDTLYSGGYEDDITLVTDTYTEAISVIVDYNMQSVHKYFTRYNYADFLARNNIAANETTITTVLSPMVDLNQTDNVAQTFFIDRLDDKQEWNRSDRFTGHPETMRNIAEVSPEFALALQEAGANVQEQ
jgi:hypothetical protein